MEYYRFSDFAILLLFFFYSKRISVIISLVLLHSHYFFFLNGELLNKKLQVESHCSSALADKDYDIEAMRSIYMGKMIGLFLCFLLSFEEKSPYFFLG